MKHAFLLFFLFFQALAVSNLHAETKTFVREYTYNAGEADSKLSCRTLALDQVKRLLLEEVGVYLESVFNMSTQETSAEGNSSVQDTTTMSIEAITAGFTQTVILEEKWDGSTYYLRAKIELDPDDVLEKVKSFKEDREQLEVLQAYKNEQSQALKEIDSLKALMARLKSENEALKTEATQSSYQDAQARYLKNVSVLSSGEYLQQAAYAWSKRNYSAVLILTDKAIEANSENTKAYALAAGAYYRKNQPDSALVNFNKAIMLKPAYAKTYYGRAMTYLRLRQFQPAILDFTTYLKFKPRSASAYFERGKAHLKLRQRRMAIRDIRTAAKLGHPRAKLWLEKSRKQR